MTTSGGDGPRQADRRLGETIYQKLRELARRAMRGERAGHTLQPTALIHEAYLKLARVDDTIVDENHFLALAALQMRRVLVDGARARRREKRTPRDGGVVLQGPDGLGLDAVAGDENADLDEQVLKIDEALQRLAAVSPRRARLVELRFFAGLSIPEAAQALQLSERTAARDWQVAKEFLRRVLA